MHPHHNNLADNLHRDPLYALCVCGAAFFLWLYGSPVLFRLILLFRSPEISETLYAYEWEPLLRLTASFLALLVLLLFIWLCQAVEWKELFWDASCALKWDPGFQTDYSRPFRRSMQMKALRQVVEGCCPVCGQHGIHICNVNGIAWSAVSYLFYLCKHNAKQTDGTQPEVSFWTFQRRMIHYRMQWGLYAILLFGVLLMVWYAPSTLTAEYLGERGHFLWGQFAMDVCIFLYFWVRRMAEEE